MNQGAAPVSIRKMISPGTRGQRLLACGDAGRRRRSLEEKADFCVAENAKLET